MGHCSRNTKVDALFESVNSSRKPSTSPDPQNWSVPRRNGTTSNNGNIQSYTYSGGGLSYTQSFTYDSLNRLSSATETNGGSTNWSQTNAYDRYSNRQIDYGGGSYNLAFSSSTNRITTSGFSYDSAGNLTNDTIHTYAFDGNEKIKSVDSTTAYTYDGEGKRVRKLLGENTRFVYGIGDELVAEYDGSNGNLKKEYVSGGITIEPTGVNSNGTQYITGDHLGSPRVVTGSSGSVVSRHDYMPFGEELGPGTGGRTTGMGFSGSGDNNREKFTGYQRDTESGLDFAQACHYGNAQGRFTSPDPFSGSATIVNPQTFNRYTYCGNNPLNSVDPGGLAATGTLFSMSYGDGRDMHMSSKAYGSWSENISEDTQAYDARLSNTLDTVRANKALESGQGDLARTIVRNNPNLRALGVDRNDVTETFLGEPQDLHGTPGPGANATAQSATGGPHNTVIITYSDGTQEVRSGGRRTWRNNNPGNIRPGDLQGEIGAAGGFAVFSSETAGDSAIIELLNRPRYQRLTVSDAIATWAPAVDHNDTAAYQAYVQRATGIDGQTRMNTLTDGQLRRVADAIRAVEGWAVGTVTYRRP